MTIAEGRERALVRRESFLSARSIDRTPVGTPPGPAQGYIWLTSDTGRHITPEEAKQAPTVQACRSLIAGSLARMEWRVLRRGDRARTPLRDHALYGLLNRRPNADVPAVTLREALIYDLLDYGNSYAYIERKRGSLKPVALHKLRPDRMEVERHPETGDLVYRYFGDDFGNGPMAAVNVLHFRGPSQDGLLGDAIPALMRHAIAIELDAQTYVASYLGNGSRPSGVLTVPGKLKDDEKKVLQAQWRGDTGGSRKVGATALLEGGVKWEKTSIDPDEAQLIESRGFARQVICGFFHVPPHLIGDASKQSYASAEQGSWEFVTYCLNTWAARMEGEVQFKLVDEPDLENEISFAALLRGDLMSRMKAHALGVANGIKTRNECREVEGDSPIDGGDAISVPLNMAFLDPDATKEGATGVLAIGGAGTATGGSALPGGDVASSVTPSADPSEAVPAAGASVQDTALNGAQVSSALEIVLAVKDGKIPPATGKAMLASFFPGIAKDEIDAMIDPLVAAMKAAPPEPQPPEAPPPEPAAPPEPSPADPPAEPEETPDAEPS